MNTTLIPRLSAGLLFAGGAGLLFAADALVPFFAPTFPRGAAWLGQLLGAAWLGVAALNWLQRGARLGGIYGRPVVFANLTLYFVTALVLARAGVAGAGRGVWMAAVPAAAMAVAYGLLLFRGPFGLPPQSPQPPLP